MIKIFKMQQLISMLLIITFIVTFVIVKPSFGDLTNGSGGEIFFWGFMIITFIGVFIFSVATGAIQEKPSNGWIEAKITSWEAYYMSDKGVPHLMRKIKIIENDYIYPTVQRFSPIGKVLSGEVYKIESEKNVSGEIWYEILFPHNHLMNNNY